MVIYLQKKIKYIICYSLLFLCIVIFYFVSNTFVFIRYDDKEFIDDELLVLENKELRDKLEGLEYFDNEYIVGKVLFRDLYNFYEEIVVDVSEDVNVGDAVVNDEGLIGVVSKVDNKVHVKLLTSNYRVSVSIGECYGNLSNGKVNMVDKDCNIKIGDVISTSGLNDINKGIYVGKVSRIDDDGLGLTLDVDLIDNKHLNYVGVIK